MFVVRISGNGKNDWKVFDTKPPAFTRFVQARQQINEEEHEGFRAALFQVPSETDVRQAIKRVEAGDALLLEKSWLSHTSDEEAEIMRLLLEIGEPQPKA